MLLSVAASVLLVLSVLVKDRIRSLTAQSLSCLLNSLYDFTIAAYTSAVLQLSNFIRTFLFMKRDKFGKRAYLAVLIVFECIVVVNCFFTWAGFISLLPTTASVVRTYCLWQTDMKLIRISGIVSGFLFSVYYLFYRSWFLIMGYGFLFAAGVYAFVRNDVLKSSKE